MFLKKVIKFFFSIFNLGIYNTDYFSLVSKNAWLPTLETNKNKLINLYYEGLTITKSQKNGSFSRLLRYYSLAQLAEFSIKNNKEFDFVECGCFRGHSTWMISKILHENNFNKNFHIFDSFSGYSKLNDKDLNLTKKISSSGIKKQRELFISEEESLKKILENFNFAKIYKDWIPNKFNEIKDRKFQFVHLDLSLYQPTLDSLNFFFPKLIDGGIIVSNGYNFTQFPGEKVAFDEYFKDKKFNFFHELPYGGAFIIK